MTPISLRAALLSVIAITILQAAKPTPGLVKRGGYLVTIMGCNDCHTPLKMGPKGPEPDMDRLLSGHPEAMAMPPGPALPPGPWVWIGAGSMTAFTGPWGVTYSANLTPDKDTSIVPATAAEFIRNIRSGRHLGKGRPVLPPMPIQNLQATSDADLQAIHAYLRSIPAIKNKVPALVESPAH